MKLVSEEGTILQLQGFSVNDGEGVRTVIFLPGCPLRCAWCSNPETWDFSPKLAVYDTKCIGCGECQKVCPQSISPPKANAAANAAEPAALGSGFGGSCTACGICVNACTKGALAVLCEKASVHDVIKRVERDDVFFRYSGGGVTFSGGEPTVQEGFLRALAREFYKRGISVWIETCGFFKWENVKDIFEIAEHVFYDIKCIDSKLHMKLTGMDNAVILENCVKLHNGGVPVTVRVPAIIGANFTDENIEATAQFLSKSLPGANVELLPYHNFGNEKYKALGMAGRIHEFSAPSREEIMQAYTVFRSYGIETVEYK